MLSRERATEAKIPRGFLKLAKMFKNEIIKVGHKQYPKIDIVLYRLNSSFKSILNKKYTTKDPKNPYPKMNPKVNFLPFLIY